MFKLEQDSFQAFRGLFTAGSLCIRLTGIIWGRLQPIKSQAASAPGTGMNEDNQAEIMTMHQKLTTMKVCPNGRYVLTGGNRGDCMLWKIDKKIHEPDAIRDAVRE